MGATTRRRVHQAAPSHSWKGLVWSLGAALVVTISVSSTLRINFTSSLPRGIYRMVSGPRSRGALVIACLPPEVGVFARARGYLWRGECPGGAAPVGKAVAAVAGDTVTATAGGLIVNGHLLPNSRPLARDRQGRRLQRVGDGTYVVSPGKLWLTSSYNPASFDSRYFGPVPEGAVISGIEPLWTLGSIR